MKPVHRWRWAAAAATLAAGLAATGCGTPGAPQPPSLNLPDRVTDLSAIRTGNRVSLTWTMPKKNTDKLVIKSDIQVAVCRREVADTCSAVTGLTLTPGAAGSFAETLPPALATGAPRPLRYFVELKNRKGRSAGLSNAAVVLAGAAPGPVEGLSATVRKSGVVLRWSADGSEASIRLHRKLLNAAAQKPKGGLMAPPPQPTEQNLLVQAEGAHDRVPDHALDKTIVFGESYEYRAQRVVQVAANGNTLELAGEISAPVHVEALDVFPPAVPTGLAAVATAPDAGTGTEASIDLSWLPNVEADQAGYAVYRREGDGPWQRISPAQPVVAPAFHDTQVQAGHTYRYCVSAIDQGGHESAHSAEAQETVPAP